MGSSALVQQQLQGTTMHNLFDLIRPCFNPGNAGGHCSSSLCGKNLFGH